MQSQLRLFLVAIFCLGQIGCAVSSSPNVSEIVATARPTISGSYDISLTASSSIFNVSGTCSTTSFGTEYSIDSGVTWTDLGLCSTGTYSFNVVVFSTLIVQVRSRTKFAATESSYGRIRVIIPPTARLLTFVTASNSANSSLTAPRLSFTMSPYLSGKRSSGVNTWNMDHLTTGIVYAP